MRDGSPEFVRGSEFERATRHNSSELDGMQNGVLRQGGDTGPSNYSELDGIQNGGTKSEGVTYQWSNQGEGEGEGSPVVGHVHGMTEQQSQGEGEGEFSIRIEPNNTTVVGYGSDTGLLGNSAIFRDVSPIKSPKHGQPEYIEYYDEIRSFLGRLQ